MLLTSVIMYYQVSEVRSNHQWLVLNGDLHVWTSWQHTTLWRHAEWTTTTTQSHACY